MTSSWNRVAQARSESGSSRNGLAGRITVAGIAEGSAPPDVCSSGRPRSRSAGETEVIVAGCRAHLIASSAGTGSAFAVTRLRRFDGSDTIHNHIEHRNDKDGEKSWPQAFRSRRSFRALGARPRLLP